MRQVIEKLVQLDKELNRLRDVEAENYLDLIDQARRRWGRTYCVSHEEFEAFLESRFTHRPTQSLREHLNEVSKSVKELERNNASLHDQVNTFCVAHVELEKKIEHLEGWVEYYKNLAATARKQLTIESQGNTK